MPEALPESHRDLLEGKTLAQLACHLADGTILVNPVWCVADGDTLLVSSVEGRLKDRAMRRTPKVTLCLVDAANPFRYLEIRGHVREITHDGADALINRLAKKYLDQDTYPFGKPGDVRVAYHIVPEKVVAFGR